MLPPRIVAVLALVLAGPAAARAADLDPYLPADTESYLSVKVRQILDSPVFKKQLLVPARAAIKEAAGGQLDEVLKDLGLDPFKDIDRLIIASPAAGDTDRGLVVLHGNYDAAKFKTKAEEAARDNPDVLKIHKVPLGGGASHVVYEVVVPNQDLSVYVSLANNKTILASPGKDYVVDALKQGRLRKKPALKNKDFQALLEKLDGKQSLSLAVLGKALAGAGSDDVPKFMAQALKGIEAIGGGVTVSNEFKMEVLVATKDTEAARRMHNALDRGVKLALVGLSLLGDERKEMSLLLEVFKTVKVSSKGKVVGVSAKLTQDVIDDYFKKDG
jgi:hypothetical protein